MSSATVVHGMGQDALVDGVMDVSRALVAVAARALAAADPDVTLPQLRALVVLAARGEQTVGSLAELLDVNPSSVTRLCDRLAGRGLVERAAKAGDRREVRLVLTRRGARLVDRVTARRRADIGAILARMAPSEREAALVSLAAFARAAEDVIGPTSIPSNTIW